MAFLFSVIQGIALGIGAILPGISSGVLCVIFGIYENLVNSVLGIFKDFKKNFLFLLPIFIGIFIGIFAFGNVLNFLFTRYNEPTKILFMGLILGGIPCVFKQAISKKGFRLHYLLYSLVTFLLSLFFIFLEHSNSFSYSSNYNFIFLIFCGFLMSAGIIIPGVSSSVILMLLGIYYTYIEAVSFFNLSVLIPMGIGVVIGSILFLLLIKFLFKNYYTQTFFAIIGFVLGSTLILLPNSFSFAYILLFISGFFIALNFEK